MLTSEFDQENVIPVTEANLKDEQMQTIAKAMEDYKQQCLRSFSINRSGEVIQKDALPMPRQVTFEANPGKLQEMVDSAINQPRFDQPSWCAVQYGFQRRGKNFQGRTNPARLCGAFPSSANGTRGYGSIGCLDECKCTVCRPSKYIGDYWYTIYADGNQPTNFSWAA